MAKHRTQCDVSMTNSPNRIEVVTSVQRRRRWTASEKVRMVEECITRSLQPSRKATFPS